MDEINLNYNNTFNSLLNKYSEVAIPVKNKIKSERAEIISFFVENLRNKKDKKFPARMIAVKLSHIKELEDLYYFKSVFTDILNRKGKEGANKYFWWSLKSK